MTYYDIMAPVSPAKLIEVPSMTDMKTLEGDPHESMGAYEDS